MIKLPVKDPDTVPWMSRREIPVVKAVLSAWRAERKNPEFVKDIREEVRVVYAPEDEACWRVRHVAFNLEFLVAIDERLRKEARDGTGHKK